MSGESKGRLEVSDWSYPAPYNHPIIELSLAKQYGELTLNNGIQHSCFPDRLMQLQVFEFGDVLKLFCLEASDNWFEENEFWASLHDVKLLHLHGYWKPKHLEFVLSKLKSLKSLSLTYWKCSNVYSSLRILQPLEELTIDLNGTNAKITDILLHLKSTLKSCSLKRLMIISPESFPGENGDGLLEFISGVLDPEANVVILYGQEENKCVKFLHYAYRYQEFGYFCIAHNTFSRDFLTASKVFDKYELYRHPGFHNTTISLTIGCRHGWFDTPALQFDDQPENQKNGADIEMKDSFYPFYTGYRHNRSPCVKKTGDYKEIVTEESLTEYVYPTFSNGKKVCCDNFVKTVNPKAWFRFGTPGWEETKVQEIVYFEKRMEMYLSNGLISMLQSKKEEVLFFRYWHASRRFIFRGTSLERRHIFANSFLEFLEFTEHIEFAGTWYTDLFQFVVKKFPMQLRAWSMTRLSHDDNPIRRVLNHFPKDLCSVLEEFHYDSRDSYNDSSVGSVLNAITGYQPLTNLRDLYICANAWKGFKANFDFLTYMKTIDDNFEDSQVVLAVIDQAESEKVKNQGFVLTNENVIFHDMFSYAPRTGEEDTYGLMEMYKRISKEHFIIQSKY